MYYLQPFLFESLKNVKHEIYLYINLIDTTANAFNILETEILATRATKRYNNQLYF